MVRRIILLSLLAAAIVLIVDAVPAAAATWSEKCKVYGPHCYTVYDWWGGEAGEQWDGAAASFNVHEAQTYGVRMQDEMWVGCGAGSKEWVESGVTMGMQDEGTPYRFTAAKVKGQYYEFDDWQVPQPMNVNLNFLIQRNAEKPGAFQIFWTTTPGSYQWVPAKEYAGLRCTYPQDVEMGLEAATFEAPRNYATSTLGLYRGGGYYSTAGPYLFQCLSEGVGLWARWEKGEYGSSGVVGQSATTAPVRRTKAYVGTGTIVSQEGETTVRKGKYKLAGSVPWVYSMPKPEPAPSGTTFVEINGKTRVARYIGEGEPNYDYMKLGIR